jgi:hypothetical protein
MLLGMALWIRKSDAELEKENPRNANTNAIRVKNRKNTPSHRDCWCFICDRVITAKMIQDDQKIAQIIATIRKKMSAFSLQTANRETDLFLPSIEPSQMLMRQRLI